MYCVYVKSEAVRRKGGGRTSSWARVVWLLAAGKLYIIRPGKPADAVRHDARLSSQPFALFDAHKR